MTSRNRNQTWILGACIASYFILCLFLPSSAWAWTGEVIGIADGDSITVLRGKSPVKIRLYGIDCPERRQPFGKQAKQFTAKMVFRKQMAIESVDTDRYGRTVAWVYIDGKNLCEELVKNRNESRADLAPFTA